MGTRQSDSKTGPCVAEDHAVDRDSAGVYFMSVEDFERRIEPSADADPITHET